MIYIWSQLKITFRKSSAPLKKSTPPCLFTHSTLKIDVCFPCLQKYKIIIVDKGWICIFFFLSGLSFTDNTNNSQYSRGREGKGEGTFFYSTLLPPTCEVSGIYLQLCMWDDYHMFLITMLVVTRLLLNEIYHLKEKTMGADED